MTILLLNTFRLVHVLASVKLFETIGPQKEFSRFKADSKLLPILRKAIVSCLIVYFKQGNANILLV